LSILCVLLAFCFDLRWDPPNLWPNLTLTQNLFLTDKPEVPPTFGPLWTLPLEVQMYVVLPALFLVFRNRSVKLLLAGWCLSVIMALVQPSLGEQFAVLKFAPCFLGGVIAWRLMRNGGAARFPGWLWPLAIAIVSITWMSAGAERFLPLHIAAFGLCLGLSVPLFKEIPWNRIKSASRIVARYSYGIYLSHFPIQIYIFDNTARHPMFKLIHQLPTIKHYARPVHWAMVIVLSVVAPLLLYHLVEKPGIRLGQWLARRITRLGERSALPSPAS